MTVLRGLHYHFKQVDYWCAIKGRIRAGWSTCAARRPPSLASAAIDIGGDNLHRSSSSAKEWFPQVSWERLTESNLQRQRRRRAMTAALTIITSNSLELLACQY